MARAATTSDAFNAIAEPQRREILVLLRGGERPVTDLARDLGMTQPQASKHLRVLREVGLVRVRSLLAGALRLRTTGAMRAGRGPFTTISAGHDVVVAGEDDKHLDFRALMEVTRTASGRSYLVLTTVVQRHNTLGRAYFALIRPFHARIVPAILRRAVQQPGLQHAGPH